MKSLIPIIIAAVLLNNSFVYAQDEMYKKNKGIAYILPAALITYGVLAHTLPPLRKMDKYIDSKILDLNAHTKVDDYLQYAPGAAVYALDICGIRAKHNLRDRTFIVASSYLMTAATVTTIKHTSRITRPDGSARNSFPSGHTAVAFTGAHILFREYYETSAWIGAAGYLSAAITGSMRMMNRRHWFGDVAAGAGIGILSVEIGYSLLPTFHKVIGLPTNLSLMPAIGNGSYGIGVACVF